MVLQNLDGNYLIGPLLPALGHLTKCAAPKKLQNFILIVEGGVKHLNIMVMNTFTFDLF